MSGEAAAAFTLEPFDYREARALMDGLGLAEPVAVTLVRRGFTTVESAQAFLEAEDDHDPFAFEAMGEVVDRIMVAVSAGRRITVHGDYDVDGVCSTAILVRALRALGADCDWLIPDRMADGYGLTPRAVETLVIRGTALLITVDCGIGSAAEVRQALDAGIEVIVTDHHQPGAVLPDCPILHPALSDYPFDELCATGVAYKLAAALRSPESAAGDLDLVALATVADLVPLRGENRALVRRGLAEARIARRPGMRALMASASVAPERLDEGDLAFRLAPRINAAGRLYRADAGVELMLTDDSERAARIASELERANRERREVEDAVLTEANRARGALPTDLADAPGIVLAGKGWHPGVVGIVASRLAERLWRPVVLIGIGADGRGRGSGRSVPGFDLLAALDACAEHLTRYGGHRAAAGLEIEADRIDPFRRAFAAAVAERLPADARVRSEPVDAIVGGESLGHDVAEQLERLAPFGNGNPGVRLLVPGARLNDVRPMGEGERHARFSLASGPRRALGVAFGVNGALSEAARGGPLDVSLRLELNEWNGAVEPRVVLGRLYPPVEESPSQAEASEAIDDEEFWARFDAEAGCDLDSADRCDPASPERRVEVDRRGASAIATIAALVSTGAGVLVVCADAVRRRGLVESAARPARFGGGGVAIVSGRFSAAHCADVLARVGRESGVVLADWAALRANPALALGFAHVVIVDPPASAGLLAVADAGSGYLHDVGGPAEAEFAIAVHRDEWPSRSSLAALYRELHEAEADLDAEAARLRLCGAARAHPLRPEVAARAARVLGELGLLEWVGSGINRTLGVVSSKGTDLERSAAFVAYRRRYEEELRYLTARKQS